MQQKNQMLKICGILMIIGGSAGLLTSLFAIIDVSALAAAAFTRFQTAGYSMVRLFLMPKTGLGGRSGRKFDSMQNVMLTSTQTNEM